MKRDFWTRDFGPLRVLIWRVPYEQRFERHRPQRIYVCKWSAAREHVPAGDRRAWEIRFFWIELRWRVHRGVRLDRDAE